MPLQCRIINFMSKVLSIRYWWKRKNASKIVSLALFIGAVPSILWWVFVEFSGKEANLIPIFASFILALIVAVIKYRDFAKVLLFIAVYMISSYLFFLVAFIISFAMS